MLRSQSLRMKAGQLLPREASRCKGLFRIVFRLCILCSFSAIWVISRFASSGCVCEFARICLPWLIRASPCRKRGWVGPYSLKITRLIANYFHRLSSSAIPANTVSPHQGTLISQHLLFCAIHHCSPHSWLAFILCPRDHLFVLFHFRYLSLFGNWYEFCMPVELEDNGQENYPLVN